jgi:hypothetical protein
MTRRFGRDRGYFQAFQIKNKHQLRKSRLGRAIAPCWVAVVTRLAGRCVFDRGGKAVRYVREYIATIDEGHWILLSQRLKGKWAFLIWSAEPVSGDLGPAGEQIAKEQVAAFAKRYFAQDRTARVLPDVRRLRWQVATEISWLGDGGSVEEET